MKKDVIIIGAGASGLMCAIEAGKRGRSVLVIDHADKPARKVRISGGGYCNFTNVNIHPEAYLSENPDFCKSGLARFGSHDFIGMLDRHGIKYIEKEDGCLFCTRGSAVIIDMLLKECKQAGAEMSLGCRIADVSKGVRFRLSTNCGVMESESLVTATGGMSYPSAGATGIGYKIARHFGLRVTPLKPALVPMVLSSGDAEITSSLSGVSVDGVATCNGRSCRGSILFTHKGLSGPAILNISLYWDKGDDIVVNLLPDIDALKLFMDNRRSRKEMHNFLSAYLPKRLCRMLCEISKPINQYTAEEFKALAQKLHAWTLKPAGTEGYGKAEVTSGGVDTDELSSKTMESKKIKGLYFIGEVADVTGKLGGFNLQWAWSSGYAAGQYA